MSSACKERSLNRCMRQEAKSIHFRRRSPCQQLSRSLERQGPNRSSRSFPDSLTYFFLYLFDCFFFIGINSQAFPCQSCPWEGCRMGERRVAHQTAREAQRDGVMDGGHPVINNQTRSFYWGSHGKCSFGNICLHPTNNKWCFFPFLCFLPPFPPSLSLFWLFSPRFSD